MLRKKSGKASILYKLEELKIDSVSEDLVGDILGAVKQKGIAKKDILTDTEFFDFVREISG